MSGTGLRQHPVVLFDGVCNLCTGAVKWIISRDPEGIFHFASLQSRGEAQLESIVLIDGEREYRRSSAFLQILRRLPRYRWLAYVGAVVPEVLRDRVYEEIAGRRYALFGKMEECMVPTPDIEARFVTPPARGGG
jgi:predicted DCC family thiol-disulfide oxidoreductase YuxK